MYSWNDLVNREDFQMIENGYLYAYYTDKILFQEVEKIDFTNLLELRIFDKNHELKLFRPLLDSKWYIRFKDDANLKEEDYFDQNQYLDIDSTQTKDSMITATGGGTYPLPIEIHKVDAYITIRNYVSYYPETGQSYVSDWRIVSIKEGVIPNGK